MDLCTHGNDRLMMEDLNTSLPQCPFTSECKYSPPQKAKNPGLDAPLGLVHTKLGVFSSRLHPRPARIRTCRRWAAAAASRPSSPSFQSPRNRS